MITEKLLKNEIPHLHRYAISLASKSTIDPEDLLQTALRKAIERQHQFKEGTNLRSWLFTILKNTYIDGHRERQRRGPHQPLEEWHSAGQCPPAQDKHMELQEVASRFSDLRRCDQRVVIMSVYQGMPQDQIADRLGVAVGTVKSRLSRARDAISV